MPTTSPALARVLLDGLRSSGIKFALLHQGDDVIDGSLRSDVDVVVSEPHATTLAAMQDLALDAGLRLVCKCHYDIGGCSTFWATADAGDGVHLDMIQDPSGRGRLGIRTGSLLDAADGDGRWPVLDPDDRLLYLLRKRHWKSEGGRLDALRNGLSHSDRQRLKTRAEELFSVGMAPVAWDLLDGALPRRAPTRSSRMRQPVRLLQRLHEPCGFWAEFVGRNSEAAAREVESRFSRFLVHTKTTQRPRSSLAAPWYVRTVAPVRFRAGLVLSTAPDVGRWPSPDLSLPASVGVGEAAVAVVSAMADRYSAIRDIQRASS